MWRAVCGLGLILVGCSSTKPAASPSSSAKPGQSPEVPVVTCGPEEAYEYVATRVRCPDGSNPLGGDVERAARARRGSQAAPRGEHILDVYDVPCARGDVAVYVDIYGCPEYESIINEGAPGPAIERAFRNGHFVEVLALCDRAAIEAGPHEALLCSALVPASLYALRQDTRALETLTATCQQLPPSSDDDLARAGQLAMTLLALANLTQSGKFGASQEQRELMLSVWLQRCDVPEAQLEAAIERMR